VSPDLKSFFLGSLVTASAVAALFFLRYWRSSGDRLFAFFCLAFTTLTLHWTSLWMVDPAHEGQHNLYLIRLLAFTLILAAIIDKNRRSRRS
jgi:hypothetical protein